ncbi:MAG: amidohydrolase [Bacteroidales bacterium]|nr:amidohydrolase [Bacteroidales bacterium]
MDDLKLLGVQADLVWENPQQNRLRLEQIIDLHQEACDLILLPETFTTGFPVDPQPFAESEEGESLQWMHRLSQKTGAVITGSLLLKTGNRFSNSLIWMRPDGSYERYDKRHVFSMGGEHHTIQPGQKQLTVQLKGWNIRPMVCYDLRFPVWSKNHYQNGVFEYDLAIYVANWPAVRAYPWNQLLLARAIENQACIVGINRVGKDGLGNLYQGDSKVVDAKGQILSEAPEGKEAAFTATLSGKELQRFRNKFDVGRDWDSFTLDTN